jgi:glycosyltransferase involved in cell wall biosynthesis
MVITRGDTVGGSQTHVLEATRAMRASGHDARIWLGCEGEFTSVLDRACIPYEVVEGLKWSISPVADVRAYLRLKRALKKFSPDLISTHSTKAAGLGNLGGRALGIPVVFTAHGWLIAPGASSPRQLALRWGHRLIARLASATICVCDYDRRLAVDHGLVSDDRIVVVHNSVADAEEIPRADAAVAPPHLITVTRLAPPKDVGTVLEALATICDRAWTFEVVGDGPMREALETQIARLGLEDRVRVSGTCNDVASRLGRAQIFVLSTDREGFPMSVLEAMRAGLPVVASDVGGICEAVLQGESGLMVRPRSVEEMAAALTSLIEDAALRASFGAAGRRRFEEHFGFEAQIRALWGTYARVIDTQRG